MKEEKKEQESLKERLAKAKEEQRRKKEEMAKQPNPMDSHFPDIMSKPGSFLPSIFTAGESKGDFDVFKLDTNVKQDAEDL